MIHREMILTSVRIIPILTTLRINQLFNQTEGYDKYHVNEVNDYHHISFKYHK